MADEKTMYAWTNFPISETDDKGNVKTRTIRVGEVVTADDLGVDEDEWDYLVSQGAVRYYEHPDLGSFSGSPVEFRKAELAAAAEGGFFDTQYGGVGIDAPVELDAKGNPIEPGSNAGGSTGNAKPGGIGPSSPGPSNGS